MSRPVELSGYDEFMRKQGLGLDHRGPPFLLPVTVEDETDDVGPQFTVRDARRRVVGTWVDERAADFVRDAINAWGRSR